MRWFQAHNFFDSFRPIYLVTKLFHIHFETVDFQLQSVRRTLLDQFRFILTVLLDLIFVYRSARLNLLYLHLTESVLLNVGCYLSLLLLYLLTLTIPLWNRYKTDEVFQICYSINDCDRKLSELGVVIDHRRDHLISTLSAAGWMGIAMTITLNAATVRLNQAFNSASSAGLEVLTVAAILRMSTNLCMFVCYSSLTLLSINQRLNRLRDVMM